MISAPEGGRLRRTGRYEEGDGFEATVPGGTPGRPNSQSTEREIDVIEDNDDVFARVIDGNVAQRFRHDLAGTVPLVVVEPSGRTALEHNGVTYSRSPVETFNDLVEPLAGAVGDLTPDLPDIAQLVLQEGAGTSVDQSIRVMSAPQHIGDLIMPWPSGHFDTCISSPLSVVILS